MLLPFAFKKAVHMESSRQGDGEWNTAQADPFSQLSAANRGRG
jgi:hypothetical protein